MTAPGLAMFYSGLVRKKNVLGVMMQCVFLMGLMTVVWGLWGYSLAFGGNSTWLNGTAYGKWIGIELSTDNRRAIYIPKGCAHGFQTLLDDTEVSYLMSDRYVPEAAAGVRFDDPCIGIDWPLEVSSVSERDRNWPDFGSHACATAP